MKELMIFRISENKYIEILSYNDNDNNIYFFDEIAIIYHKHDERLVLYDNDYASEGIRTLYNGLDNALKKTYQVNQSLIMKGLGYKYNIYCHNIAKNDIYKHRDDNPVSHYHVLSTTRKYSNETFIYNYEDEIYIEISPQYKWHYDDPNPNEDYIEYEQFIAEYKPYDVIQIEKKLVENLAEKLKVIIEDMVK